MRLVRKIAFAFPISTFRSWIIASFSDLVSIYPPIFLEGDLGRLYNEG
jgi:hypothetical protein